MRASVSEHSPSRKTKAPTMQIKHTHIIRTDSVAEHAVICHVRRLSCRFVLLFLLRKCVEGVLDLRRHIEPHFLLVLRIPVGNVDYE